jgi:tetratricopeptide (TPR) repeat protein
MTLLLAHPAAEDLGRFVEGTLPDNERGEVVAHIADCDECRILVVDSAEFIEPAKKESPRWWAAVAASILILAGGGYLWQQSRDPERPMIEASAKCPNRLIESRLSNFDYAPRSTMRGGGGDDDGVDLHVLQLQDEAGRVLDRSGDSPKIMHAHGVAHLVVAATAKSTDNIDIKAERRAALEALEAAANRDPKNVDYQNDVAAVLLSTGDPKQRDLAMTYLDKALSIDSRNQEALFNRALALRESNPKEAIAAFQRYLAVDPSSKWADEARQKIKQLQEVF